ncbi:hypothetical protein D3C75_1230070 [compost metagenome]
MKSLKLSMLLIFASRFDVSQFSASLETTPKSPGNGAILLVIDSAILAALGLVLSDSILARN